MKRLLLCFFLTLSAAFATDYATVYNFGWTARFDFQDENFNTVSLWVPNGGTFFVPRDSMLSSSGVTDWGDPYNNQVVASHPILYFGPDGSYTASGEWPVNNWQAFSYGNALALPVVAYLLGAWLLRRGVGIGNGALGED